VANGISVTIGITTSFILNMSFNFRVKDRLLKRFLLFISVGFGGLILSSALLFYFIDVLFFEKIIAKLISIGIVVTIQYFLNKHFTFKKVQYD
jgi:putative flippase GtrA